MKIVKGTVLKISARQGVKIVKALKDFDTVEDEYWDCELISDYAEGMTREWIKGDKYPLRRGIARVISIETEAAI